MPAGGFGYDFSWDIGKLEEALSVVSKGILANGVTSYCPTLVTSPSTVYHEVRKTGVTFYDIKSGWRRKSKNCSGIIKHFVDLFVDAFFVNVQFC